MNGYYGDHAYTFAVGEISEDRKKTHRGYSLSRGIYSCRIGNCTGDIGYAIHNYAEKYGSGVVIEYTD
ncbi:M24 family metallopeptidase [Candidatus Walczuchella endosymbiont of Icerya purchasi]|uniref:M24 family metallopeptidase n=1 Tax=Candidatus Walczuchella endosymbiont of Icerya purchasi TaxID=3066219 RepID=UPI00313CAD9B